MEELKLIITYIVLAAAETFIGYRFFIAYLTRNNVSQYFYNLSVIFYFFFQLWSYIADCPLFSTATYYLLFSAAISLMFFSDKWQNKFIISLMYVIMNYACKTMVTAIFVGMGHADDITAVAGEGLVLNPTIQLWACVLFVLCLAGTIALRRARNTGLGMLYTGMTFIFPLSVLALTARTYKNFYNDSAAAVNYFDIYAYLAAFLFAGTIGLFYLMDKSKLLDISGEQSAVMKELLALQREHYGKLEHSQKEMRSLRHDIKHHFQYIGDLIRNGQTAEAQKYIDSLYANNMGLKSLQYSGNMAIDSTLSHSLAEVYAKGIDLKYSIITPPDLSIDDVDLCILFGNLLDNSVEACDKITDPRQKKFITINAKTQKNYLVVSVTNSFNGEVVMDKEAYRTTKVNQRYCGIGLANIYNIINKYNGEISVEHTQDVFTVFAMLSMTNPQQI